MINKEVCLCDVCKEKVAKHKCAICSGDCCSTHKKIFCLRAYDGNGKYAYETLNKSIVDILCCSNCYMKAIRIKIPGDVAVDWIRDSITLNELKKEE